MIRSGSVLGKLDTIKEATSRDFKGGLDVADSELNLSSKFARELDNLVVGIDGSLQVRQGCRLFADLSELTDYDLVDYQYYQTRIISVDEVGQVFMTNGRGDTTRIWDSAIAAAKRSGLSIWGVTNAIKFEEFGGELIIANGTDKPLLITENFIVDYLADPATGSNVNVPVSRIFTKHARHLIWADGSRIIASERDSAGTYNGDPGAVYVGDFDLGSYVTGDPTILGMLSFKGFLMVYFRECIVPVQLEETTGDTPTLVFNVSPDSIISNYGSVSQRTVQDIGEQALSLDIAGVASSALTKFTKILSPDRPSRFVDPLLQRAIGQLTADELDKQAFAIYDRRLTTYTVFLPDDIKPHPRETKGYSYRYLPQMDVAAWSTCSGWSWQCGTRSSEGRLFFTPVNSRKIFIVGDQVADPIYADFVGEQETFSDGTAFTDGKGLFPIADIDRSGVPINFSWELPYTDLRTRGRTKTLRYIILDTEGDQQFDVEVYIDNKQYVVNGGEAWQDTTLFTDETGFDYLNRPRTPALVIPFIAKDAGAYGIQRYGNSPYGSGNNTASHGLTLTPTKFDLLKLRFCGSAMGPMKFVSITLMYQVGSIRRMIV